MNTYSFILPYPPSNNRYYRHAKGIHYISNEGRAYRAVVANIIHCLDLDISLESKLSVTVYVAPPDSRVRDLDNIPKCLFDSLSNARFWKDDSQIDAIKLVRCQKVKKGKIFVVVRERSDTLPDIEEYINDTWGIR
ncbi:RusA family crossover junction endodeoxyribonuclease [Escherichia coli]